MIDKQIMINQLVPAIRKAYPEVYFMDYLEVKDEEYCVVYFNKQNIPGHFKITITADSLPAALVDIAKGLARNLL